jgi:deoxyribonuclease-2
MFRFLFSLFAVSTVHSLSCIGDTGQTTDSWFGLKEPLGSKYLYYDGEALAPSKHSMNDTTVGALANTVQQLWSPSTQYLIFNDEPSLPNNPPYNFTVGHTKGIWAWNNGGEAFLLLHSVPLYPMGPSYTAKYRGLGSNAYTYGQSLACFTVTADILNTLAASATLTVPDIYDSRVDASSPPNLVALAKGTVRTDSTCEHQDFETVGGTHLTYFAKSSQWNNELYSACIAPSVDQSLLVESWIRGSAEGPFCGQPEVFDVKTLQFTPTIGFSEVDDHSKWAVSLNSSFLCIADINRMTTQYERGGSAICWNDAVLAAALQAAVTTTDNSC